MSAAVFRSNGKTIVNLISIFDSQPAILIQSRVGQILSISDFRPALWLGCLGQAARLGEVGLAGLGLGGPAGWAGMASRPGLARR